MFFISPGDISSFIVGSDIVPKAAKPEDGAVDGYIYPLTTPSQIKRYKAFIDLLSYSGLAAPITDWSRTLAGEGTPVERLNNSQRGLYAVGALTPSYGIPAWKQDYFNKLAKLQAIKASATKIEKEVQKETAIESAAIPQTPEQKAQVEESKISIAVAESEKAKLNSKKARLSQIMSELSIPNLRKQLYENYNGNEDRLNTEYANPRMEEAIKLQKEIEKLEEKLNPPKAANKEAEGSRQPRPERQPRPQRQPRPPREPRPERPPRPPREPRNR